MEKRLTWSGILVKPDHGFFLFSHCFFFFFSGSLICYEFLSPLTPRKIFSWRSWQIESDRQTGSSVRPQESHSSRAVSPPSITEEVLWLPGRQWLQRQLVHQDLSQSYQRPGREQKEPLSLNESASERREWKTSTWHRQMFKSRIKNSST